MGAKLSRRNRNKARLNDDNSYSTDHNRNHFRIDAVSMTREQVDEILEDVYREPGTFILYQEPEYKRTYLAFKTEDEKIAHYVIVKKNDLYYFNDFPFPYLESIVLYYKKYKFKGTLLTKQASPLPFKRIQRHRRTHSRCLSASADALDCDDQNWTLENEKTWTYGHFDTVTRL